MGRIEIEEATKSPFPHEFRQVWTPPARFVTADDAQVEAEMQSYRRLASKRWFLLKKLGYWLAASVFTVCLLVHVVGLLVFFTPWYNASVQVWIFRRFYSSFASSDFLDDIDAKRSAVAFVYLLFVGLVPTVVASSLWFALSSHRGLRRIVQTPSFLHRKHVFFSKWRPIFFDMTYGQLAMMLSLFAANAFIFMQVLWRAKTQLTSPSEKIFRDVSRGFGFNATFTMVWLLLFLLKPSSWSLYVDIFGFTNISKYRKWLAIVVVGCSILHGICMAVSLAIKGEFTSRLFPSWNKAASDQAIGGSVFGELALAGMLIGMILVYNQHRLNGSVVVIARSACGLATIVALCLHYPLAIAWLLPPLLLLLIQNAVAWTHTGAPVELIDIAPLPYGITRIVIRRSVSTSSSFTPGQFIYLNLPIVSWLQWHRCAIANSPDRSPDEIKLYVSHTRKPSESQRPFKSSWAGQFHGVAERAYADKQAPVVHADGFYGPTSTVYYDEYRCLVLVAKNKGIVELLSILEQLYYDAWRAKSEAFAHKDARRFTALEDGLDIESSGQGLRQVWLMWTFEDVCLFKAFEELFFRIQALDPTEEFFRLRFFLTKIPTREDLLYQRVPACDFQAASRQARPDGAPQDGLGSENPCRRAPYRLPQNHGGLFGWPSRPFQQALSGRCAKMAALWLVLIASIPLSISGEWHTLSLLASNSWQPMGSVVPVFITLLVAGTVAGTAALLNDYILSHQRRRRKRQATTGVRRFHQAEMATPVQGITRLRSVTKRLEEDTHNEQLNREARDTVLEPREIGPDMMERFKIYTMKPDVGKFLRGVGRSFPRYAGRIGVFASGSERVVQHVENCVIASETMTGEWQAVNAAFDFHSV